MYSSFILVYNTHYLVIYYSVEMYNKEGKKHPSSVNRKRLVHNHYKAGNKFTLKTTGTLGKTQVCE